MQLAIMWGYITKLMNRESLKRTTAAVLIYSMLGSQTLTGLAGTEVFAGGNAASRASDELLRTKGSGTGASREADDNDDEEETLLLSGTITTLGTDINPKKDRTYGVYINGVLDRTLTVNLETGTASYSDWEIPILNDLDDDVKLDGEVNIWSYSVYTNGEVSPGSVCSIRDITNVKASSSNAYKNNTIDNSKWTLFYLDGGEVVVSSDSNWTMNAQNLVYVGKEVIKGSFENHSEIASLPEKISLIVTALNEDDDEYLASASGWIATGAGTWTITDALMYNPVTMERIVWRGQVDYDSSDTAVIMYENVVDFEDDTDYVYSDGIIIYEDISCTVTGSIYWNDANDKFGKRIDITETDIIVTDTEGNRITEGITISVIVDSENPSVLYYTVEGLTTGAVYDISVAVPEGYEGYESEIKTITFQAANEADLDQIVLNISDPVVITIDNKIHGLSSDEEASLTYIVYVDGEEYTGNYYIIDEEENETAGYGPITLSANEAVTLQLGITDDAVVTIGQVSTSAGIKQIGADNGANAFSFTYAAETSVLASIVWNDNKNAEGFRPDGGSDNSNWTAYLQLTFTLGDNDTQYSIEEYYTLLGLESWDGFSYLDSFGEAPDYYFAADGLPTHIMKDGEVVEVHYSVDAVDVDNYTKDEYGYVEAEYDSGGTRLNSWKFVYTAFTTFEAQVVWYDDNDNNSTRPTEEEWMENLWIVRVDEAGDEVSGQISQAEPVAGEAGVYSIIITLEDETTVNATVTIDKSEDGRTWSFEIDGLIAYDEDGISYTYYVTQETFEISDSTLLNEVEKLAYDTSYGNEGINLGNTKIVYEGGTIINTLTGHFDFTANKEWLDGDTSVEERPTVTLTLWRYTKGSDEGYLAAAKVYVEAELVYVEATGAYTVTVEDLPAFDEDGHEYIYFMTETMTAVPGGVAVSEYSLTVENELPFTTEDGISQNSAETLIYNKGTFTNTLDNTTDVAVSKIWKAKSIQGTLDDYTVTLQLQRTINGEDWENADEITLDTFALEYTSLSHTFKNQDKYDENGYEYTYRVIETEVTYNGASPDAADLSDSATIESALDGGAAYTLGKYTFIYSIDEDGNIINELVDDLDLIVEKEWVPTPDDDIDELTFFLYQNGELYNNEEFGIIDGEIKLEKDDNGTWTNSISILSLPRYDEEGREYTYNIEEKGAEWYSAIVRMDLIYDSEEQKYILTSTVTNHTGPGTATYAKVYKQWLDDSDTTLRGEVQVQLTDSNGNEVSAVSGETTFVNLNEGNCWYDYFLLSENVDFADYKIKEVSVDGSFDTLTQQEVENNNFIYNPDCEYIRIDGMIYEVSYSYKAPETGEVYGTFTVTNRRIGKISINLEKEWQENIDLNRYTVVFHLYQNGVLFAKVTLPEDNEWKHSFANLDKFDENGALYEYTLVEYSITDTETGYVYGEENSVTVGNEMILKNSDDPEDAYSVSITSKYDADAGQYEFLASNNRTGLLDLTFHKIWKDSNEADYVTRPDIYLKLYRYIDLNESGTIGDYDTNNENDAEWATAVRLDITPEWVKTDEYHWTITYPSMPKYSSSGETYIYLTQEGMAASSSGGWHQLYLDDFSDGVISADDDTGKGYMPADGAVVNYREGTTYINGTKIWENMGKYISEDDYPVIKLYLFYRLQNGNGDYGGWQYYGISTDAVWDSVLGKYTYSFNELPKYDPETGYTIQYSISEIVDNEGNENLGGFEWIEHSTNFKLTNTYSEDTDVSITVKKNWEGYPDDLTSIGYPTIYLTLYRVIQKWDPDSGEYQDISARIKAGEAVLSDNDENDWEYTWSDLSYYAPSGRPYRYYVEELNINGYTTATGTTTIATGSNTIGITNTYTRETVEIAGRKVWIDSNDKWGMRPENITLKLYRYTPSMGIGNAEDLLADFIWAYEPDDYDGRYVWTYKAQATVKEFYRYATTGERYTYFIAEEMVPGYQTPIYTATFDEQTGVWTLTVTNRLVTVELVVNKLWEDGNNQYDTRPETVTVQLQRKWGALEYEAVNNPDDPDGNAWEVLVDSTYTFTNLPKYHVDEDGNRTEYEYRAQEIDVDGGYEVSYNYESNTTTITNTLKTVNIAVKKVWEDAGNQYDTRADVTMVLYRESDGKELGRQTLSDANGWSYTWSGLPKYDSNAVEYAYYVVEEEAVPYHTTYEVAYYDNEGSLINGNDNNPISPQQDTTGSVTVTNTLKTRSVKVEKIWDDAGYWLDGAYIWWNQDGVRPDNITLELLYDGNRFDPVRTVILGKQDDGSWSWNYEWEGLPYYHADGTPFAYSVKEYTEELTVGGYQEPEYAVTEDGTLTVTNPYAPGTTSITVTKVWSGDEDWQEDRPDSIFVQLYMTIDGQKIAYSDPAEVTAENGWTYTWGDLPVYYNQGASETEPGIPEEIQYQVEEVSEHGYTVDVEGNIITNTLSTTWLQVEKIWEDQQDYYQTRPDTITIQLQRSVDNNSWTDVGDAQELVVTADETVQLIFTGLPVKDKNNSNYYYRAIEVKIGDETVPNGSAYGYQVTYGGEYTEGSTAGEVEIINTLETTAFGGTKTWDDQSNYYETRPDEIVLTLKSDPEEALAGKQPQANDLFWIKTEDNWTWIYSGLPKYMADGRPVTYYVKEEGVPANYRVTYDETGKNITNTLPTTGLSGTKIWEDQSDLYGLRPDQIELTVLADGISMKIQPQIIWDTPSGDVWTYHITGLPAADSDGTEIIYTVEETAVSGYDQTQDGYTITNKMRTGGLAVEKIQKGGNSSAEFTFHVTLTINGRQIPYAGTYTVLKSEEALTAEGEIMETSDGTIVMKGSHKFYITDLPAGASYVITEDSYSRFKLTGTVNDQGIIPYQTVTEASFTNQYRSTGGGGGSSTNTSTVVVTDGEGNTIYDGPVPADSWESIDWDPGSYDVYIFDEEGVPLGQTMLTVDEDGVPLMGLAKTGDNSLPYTLLVTIMLGTVGGMIVLIIKRRKESKEE